MPRVAIYARERPDRGGRRRLDRQVAAISAQVARQRGWQHVATYGDLDLRPADSRPGFGRLLAEAPGHIDVVVVDGYGRLSLNRAELGALLAHLSVLGVGTVVLRPPAGRRLARLVAKLALADAMSSAAR
ncbi:MAG: recombinase family protein [Actinomycetota bacterium]|jgi:DNA invertase Pin-like site-specific DNA recombinase|nr:recombinase family protein [Actinomycetota bacterium]